MQGALQVAEGVDIGLKRAEEEGQFKAAGCEAHFVSQQGSGEQGVSTFLQG